MQLDNFQSKGKSGRQIRLNEIVLIHDEHTKRLMWRKSRDGLIRSVVLRTPNGNYIDIAIEYLYPLEVGVDDPKDLDIANEEREPEADPAPTEPAYAEPALPEPASIESDVDPVFGDVDPNSTGSGQGVRGFSRLRTTGRIG